MSTKSFLFTLALLVAVVLTATFPAAGQAQQGTGGNFVLVNYIGQQVHLDLDDASYTVPGTDVNPAGGRFEIQLAPGEHKYAVNVAGVGGSAGEFTIGSGIVAKGVVIQKGEPVLDNKGLVLEKPKDEVFVFDINPFATPTPATPVVDTWQPAAAKPGMGSLVWVNYSGDDELTIDLSGQLYKVPPQANGIPGRLQIDVQPGYYRYTASVPYGSLNGEINVAAGQVTGINIVPGIKESPVYEIGEKVENPPVELKQYEEDLTGRAGTAPQVEATPTSTPAAASEAAPAQAVDSAAKAEGVTVKNFTGDTLIFTINNQAYNILANSEQMITLSPGTYNYTASLPFVATTGTVNLSQNQGVELSVAINIAGDVMSVYQN